MAIVLNNITSGYNLAKINANFQNIEDYINDKLLARAATGVAGEAMMERDLDMNGYSILNLGMGDGDGSIATKGYVDAGDLNLQLQINKALRFSDDIPQAQYGAAGRANSIQGYNSYGAPVPIFGTTGTADLAVKLASNTRGLGAGLVGTVGGLTTQQYIDTTPHISILEYIDPSKWQYLNDPTTAENNVGDLYSIITTAMKDSAFSGKPLVFNGPKPEAIGSSSTTNQSWYFPISTPLVQPIGCTILSGTVGTCYLIPTASFPTQNFLLSWEPGTGQPRMRLEGLGFSGGNYKSNIIGGFAIKRGVYTSVVKNLFIRDCYYGGLLIRPQNATGQTAAADLVNLNIDTVFILNSGNPSYYQAFDLQFSTEWGSGNWTDGAIRNVDISTAFTDNTSITQAPVSLNIYNFSKQIFNVLFERFYTSAKANTHVKIYSNSNIRNTNLTFQNFSGDGITKTALPMVDIYGLGWSHLSDMYRGSLINGGLSIGRATQCVFSNLVFNASTDLAGTYQKQLNIQSNCDNIIFRDCSLRNAFATSSPYHYKEWFSSWITDEGINTKWESAQHSSNVIVQRAFDFYNTVSAGKCTNATSQNVDITSTQTTDYLQLSYPATTGVASPTITFPVQKGYMQGNSGNSYLYAMVKLKATSATLGTHFFRFNLYDTSTTWTPDALNTDVVLMVRVPVNSSATNQDLVITLGSKAATSSAFTVQIQDFVLTSGPLPWPSNYRKSLQVI